MIITDKAKEYIKKFNINNDRYLRIACVGGGCSGLRYSLSYTNNVNKEDLTFVENEIDIIMDFKSSLFLEDITVDYSDGLNGKGFEFNNPNASSKCGCGMSFSV